MSGKSVLAARYDNDDYDNPMFSETIILVGNGIDDKGLNTGRGCSHFASRQYPSEKHESFPSSPSHG